MSVAIVEKESLELLGCFLSVEMGSLKAVEMIERFHHLNVKNYSKKYDEETLIWDDFTISNKPIIAPEQAHVTLKSIHYNCVDFGEEIDPNTLEDILKYQEKIESTYNLDARLTDFCKWC